MQKQKQNTTQKTKKMSGTNPTKNWGEPMCSRRVSNSCLLYVGVRFMVCNVTFNNISVISWKSVLLVEETEVPDQNHRPVVNHWQTLSH